MVPYLDDKKTLADTFCYRDFQIHSTKIAQGAIFMEYEIRAGFGLVGNTEKKIGGRL